MKHDLWFAVASAAALAATLVPIPAAAQSKGNATPLTKVRVVADKYVVLDQHPIVVPRADTGGRIVWELPAQGPWRFGSDSVAIDGGQFLGCNVQAQGLRYACTDKQPRKPELYPYRLTVYNGTAANAKAIFVDSSVQNE